MAQTAEKQEQVAARLRELRENARKPQHVIASEVGVTLRAYQAWEAGGGISWQHYTALARVYGVTEEFILHGPEPEAPAMSQMDRIERKLDEIRERLDQIEADAMEQHEETAALRDALRGAANGGTGRSRRSSDR